MTDLIDWVCDPYPHQLKSYLATRDQLNHALWWDQGLGKTAQCLATAAHLWRTGKIEGVFVIAPPGVETNWILDEIPTHLPRDVDYEAFGWSSKKSTTKKWMRTFEEFMQWAGLKVFAMSYKAIMTDRGAKAARLFLDDNRTLYIADESTFIKTPDAKVTKRVVASAKYASYRRVLNGTPVEDSPFALYTQVKFIDPTVWTRRGINTYAQFKSMFAEFETMHKGNSKWEQLKGYRNLDVLHECLHESGERLLKEDHLNLPDKIYQKRYFDISPKARRIYNDLKDHYTTILESGDVMDAELAIVRLTRFQQIASGYFPKGEDEELEPIDEKNPRIQCLLGALDDCHTQAIIWAKYNADIDAISALLHKRKESFGTYDGRTSSDNRVKTKNDFQEGRIRFFVSKAQAAGRGLTLTAAKTVIYYNNPFSADLRKQSEDRAHRIGQNDNVLYIDIVARDSVDPHILSVLRRKRAVSAIVTGDDLGSWI